MWVEWLPRHHPQYGSDDDSWGATGASVLQRGVARRVGQGECRAQGDGGGGRRPRAERNAWAGRISGCQLGKAVDILSIRQGHEGLTSYLREAGALPLRDYVPLIEGTVVELTGRESCRGEFPPHLSSAAPTTDAAAAPFRPFFEHDVHGAPVDLRASQGLQGGPGRLPVRHLYVSESLGAPATVTDDLGGDDLTERGEGCPQVHVRGLVC